MKLFLPDHYDLLLKIKPASLKLSTPWIPSTTLLFSVASKSGSRTISALFFDFHGKYMTLWQNPSTNPWISNTHLIRLLLSSICYTVRRRGNECFLLIIEKLLTVRLSIPSGSAHHKKSPCYFWYFLLLNAFSIFLSQDWETYKACKIYLLKQLALIRHISF